MALPGQGLQVRGLLGLRRLPKLKVSQNATRIRCGVLNVPRHFSSAVALTYKSALDPDVYTPIEHRSACSIHQSCAAPNIQVVSGVDELVGPEQTTRHTSYSYGDARWSLQGRGWLGFHTWTMHDVREGISVERQYGNNVFVPAVNDYPYRGIAVSELQTLNAEEGQISTSTIRAPRLGQNSRSYYAYVESITSTVTDSQSGAAEVSSSTQTAVHDLYGNVTFSETTSKLGPGAVAHAAEKGWTWLAALANMESAGESSQVERTYDNDTSNWLIGLPVTDTRSTRSAFCNALIDSDLAGVEWRPSWAEGVTECPTSGASSRHVTFTFHKTGDHEGLPGSATVEPDDSQHRLEVTFDYDRYGNLTYESASGVADAAGARQTRAGVWLSEEAEHIFPWVVANAKNQESLLVYDRRLGTLYAAKDPNGIISMQVTDGFGRVAAAGVSGGVITQTRLSLPEDPATQGGIAETQDSVGGSGRVVYDRLGREVERRVTGFESKVTVTRQGYDRLGRLSWRTLPYFASGTAAETLSTTYDALGRPLSSDGTDGTTTFHYYGSIVEKVDARGYVTFSVSNGAGDPIAVVDAENGVTRYDYSGGGALWHAIEDAALSHIGDEARYTTTVSYDAAGRRVDLTDPDGGTESYTYNAFDELLTQTDALNTSTSVYDELGRRTKRTDTENGSNVTAESIWRWDDAAGAGIGRLWRSESADATRELAYDAYGRLASTESSIKVGAETQVFASETGYDFAGRAVRVTYPAGAGVTDPFAVAYEYEPHGILWRVGTPETAGEPAPPPYWQLEEADARGNALRQQYGDGSSSTYSYFPRSGRLESLLTRAASGETVQDATYSWDTTGNLAMRDDRAGRGILESFTYDGLGRLRLVEKDGPGGDLLMEARYDSIGNITYRLDVGDYEYDPLHPHAVKQAGQSTYSYDALGRQYLRDHEGEQLQTDYTPFHKPREVKKTAGEAVVARYRYDADGERVLKESVDGTTVYGGAIFERHTDSSGTYDQYTVLAGGEAVAVVRRAPGAPAEPPVYLHKDHLGSVTAMTSASGPPMKRQFDHWGTALESEPAGADVPAGHWLGYTGHEDEFDLGLVNMGGRIYDPRSGRFTTPDPVVQSPFFSQNLNRYSYVHNNPLAFVDPSGFETGSLINYDQSGSPLGDPQSFEVPVIVVPQPPPIQGPSTETFGSGSNAAAAVAAPSPESQAQAEAEARYSMRRRNEEMRALGNEAIETMAELTRAIYELAPRLLAQRPSDLPPMPALEWLHLQAYATFNLPSPGAQRAGNIVYWMFPNPSRLMEAQCSAAASMGPGDDIIVGAGILLRGIGARAPGLILRAFHGAKPQSILGILDTGAFIPKNGEIFLSEQIGDTFMHGAANGAAYSIEVEVAYGSQISRAATYGNPQAFVISSTSNVPVNVLRMYVRSPNGEGGFTTQIIEGAEAIRAFLTSK